MLTLRMRFSLTLRSPTPQIPYNSTHNLIFKYRSVTSFFWEGEIPFLNLSECFWLYLWILVAACSPEIQRSISSRKEPTEIKLKAIVSSKIAYQSHWIFHYIIKYQMHLFFSSLWNWHFSWRIMLFIALNLLVIIMMHFHQLL